MADCKRKTANLFDKDSTTIYNAYFNTAGYWLLSSDSKSVKIPCQPNTEYTLSVPNSLAVFRIFESDDSNIEPTSTETASLKTTTITRSENISQYTFTTSSTAQIILFQGSNGAVTEWSNGLMLNTGSTALPYEPYGWVHSLRKLGNSTDTITTLPADIYADGTAATVSLKGNTVQSGTPTPTNPVDVVGVGVRTAQLLDFNTWANNVYVVRGTKAVSGNSITITSTAATCFTGWNTTEYPAAARIPVTEGETIHLTWDTDADDSSSVWIFPNASATGEVHTAASNKSLDYTVPSGVDYITFRLDVATANKTITYSNIMFSSGSTAKPHEPYGYKIPISSANTTTPVYLGEVETTRKIKKLVLDGTENWQTPQGTTYIYYLIITDMKQYGDCMSNTFKFTQKNASASLNDGEFTSRLGIGIAIWFKHSASTTTSDWKTYLQQQYANGTPVTVWYVLATPTTGIVNEPLRKIGDYADTVSGIAIPTITGKDTVDVETTLKPSEVSLSYTGWHDANVQEWDGSQWS